MVNKHWKLRVHNLIIWPSLCASRLDRTRDAFTLWRGDARRATYGTEKPVLRTSNNRVATLSKKSGKTKFFQGQGKFSEFSIWSGKFGILLKVREIYIILALVFLDIYWTSKQKTEKYVKHELCSVQVRCGLPALTAPFMEAMAPQ